MGQSASSLSLDHLDAEDNHDSRKARNPKASPRRKSLNVQGTPPPYPHHNQQQQQQQQQQQMHHNHNKSHYHLNDEELQQHLQEEMEDERAKYRQGMFPGSIILEKTFCGSIDTTDPAEYVDETLTSRLLRQADRVCVTSPSNQSLTEGYHGGSSHSMLESQDEDDEEGSGSDGEDGAPNRGLHHRPTLSEIKDKKNRRSSKLLARALVNEVTGNPKTMKPADMAAREKQLLKAQRAAEQPVVTTQTTTTIAPGGTAGIAGTTTKTTITATTQTARKPVGAPGTGVGPPAVLSSLAFACTGDEAAAAATTNPADLCAHPHDAPKRKHHGATATSTPPQQLTSSSSDHHHHSLVGGMGGLHDIDDGSVTQTAADLERELHGRNPYALTIAVCLSRRHAGIGHDDTITRQTAFDFNLLQDRAYKYIAQTDAAGWRAGGGEPVGGSNGTGGANTDSPSRNGGVSPTSHPSGLSSPHQYQHNKSGGAGGGDKHPNPDTIHIPILHMDCADENAVDQIIHALASGDIFIPHMAVLPESVACHGTPSPNLQVLFNCERSDDDSQEPHPEDWPNWCLEFMHNQLYEYFCSNNDKDDTGICPVWMPRPFGITLAAGVRWKTVKHMNRYFQQAESVLEQWAEQGPQYLDPQHSYLQGGASPEEVAHPHGIYILRNDPSAGGELRPTNYFGPNFDPPYTTRMTRSLLQNVLAKSWDKKRRDWTSHPMPRLVSPTTLLAVACGCADTTVAGGFVAAEVTRSAAGSTTSAAANKSKLRPPGASKIVEQKQQQEEAGSRAVQDKGMAVNATESSSSSTSRSGARDGRSRSTSDSDVEDDDDDPFAETLKQNSQEASLAALSSVSSSSLLVPEEKKMEDPASTPTTNSSSSGNSSHDGHESSRPHFRPEEPSRYTSLSSSNHNSGSNMTAGAGSDVGPMSVAASGFMSVAASGTTTVVHTNVTAAVSKGISNSSNNSNAHRDHHHGGSSKSSSKLQMVPKVASPKNKKNSQKVEKPNLFSDEDWADTGLPNEEAENGFTAVTPSSDKSRPENSSGRHSDPPGERVDSPTWVQKPAAPTPKDGMDRRGIPKSMSSSSSGPAYKIMQSYRGVSPRVSERNDSESGLSLDYSLDGSSAMFTQLTHDGSTLFGQQYALDGDDPASVKSSPTARLKGSATATTTSLVEEEEEEGLSIQESSSSLLSVVPTDEELFAVGWAKALDPSSGNYYYFTLDRKKTVWENPLTNGLASNSSAASSSSNPQPRQQAMVRPIDAPGM